MSYGSDLECAVFLNPGEGFTYSEHIFNLSRKFSRGSQSQKVPQKRRIIILRQNVYFEWKILPKYKIVLYASI